LPLLQSSLVSLLISGTGDCVMSICVVPEHLCGYLRARGPCVICGATRGEGDDGELGNRVFYTAPDYGSALPVQVEGVGG
jgi:hypothetical protein